VHCNMVRSDRARDVRCCSACSGMPMPDEFSTISAWREAALARSLSPNPGSRPVGRLALIGNFPPRRCGIATFTGDVHDALTTAFPSMACDVYAMTDEGSSYAYPAAVTYEIGQNRLADYLEAAARINRSGAQVVCIQHEYGIFGGSAGDHLLVLLAAIRAPVVTTLHTILTHPDPDQRRVMQKLVERSSRLVVMSRKGRDILRDVYGAPASKVAVIPHGTPDYPQMDSSRFKDRFDLTGREVLFTFGLLSPGKGLESMIRAMPAITEARPQALYVILGATHPHLLTREGEAYRESLQALAQSLGVAEHVRFVNTYVDNPLLLEYLSAADIYVTPYPNEAQITSGTLSYAVGLGKPVISTPYWHAAELLADDRGVLTPFNDPEAMAQSCIDLLTDEVRRRRISGNAYAAGREMIWSKLAEGYMGLFSTVKDDRPANANRAAPARPPKPRLGAIEAMTDSCGIVQHAVFSVPDRHHGYCVDDNARALILMVRLAALGADAPARVDELATLYAGFVQHAWNSDAGRFRNFMAYDRQWLEPVGSDDSFGRTFWALAETVRVGRADLKVWAASLIDRVRPQLRAFDSPRTLAFLVLGLSAQCAAHPGDDATRALLSELAHRLARQLRCERTPVWCWFEQRLSYDNARLPEALLRAGVALGDKTLVRPGLESLEWLCQIQTAPSGCFRPIGSESFGHEPYGQPQPFDQQPLEATATLDACCAAYDATGDGIWMDRAVQAYNWFLGENDLGACMVQPDGGCYDGLTPNGPNLNRGAESLLSFQMATLRMAAFSASEGVTSLVAGG
jgi:glycosyltransferase involved in cell wall biosynthesis